MNYRRGTFRVWLLLSVAWVTFFGYKVVSLSAEIDVNTSIAKSLSATEDTLRQSYVREDIAESRKRAAEYAKLGLPLPTFDEWMATTPSEEKAENFLARREERAQLLRAKEQSLVATESRSKYLWLLTSGPLGIAVLAWGALWAVSGFRGR